jgi:hypothetical protein
VVDDSVCVPSPSEPCSRPSGIVRGTPGDIDQCLPQSPPSCPRPGASIGSNRRLETFTAGAVEHRPCRREVAGRVSDRRASEVDDAARPVVAEQQVGAGDAPSSVWTSRDASDSSCSQRASRASQPDQLMNVRSSPARGGEVALADLDDAGYGQHPSRRGRRRPARARVST